VVRSWYTSHILLVRKRFHEYSEDPKGFFAAKKTRKKNGKNTEITRKLKKKRAKK